MTLLPAALSSERVWMEYRPRWLSAIDLKQPPNTTRASHPAGAERKNMMSTIEIKPSDPNFDAVAWAKEKEDATTMAAAHYLNAVLTGQDVFKIAFYDATKRAKDIEHALNEYFQGDQHG